MGVAFLCLGFFKLTFVLKKCILLSKFIALVFSIIPFFLDGGMVYVKKEKKWLSLKLDKKVKIRMYMCIYILGLEWFIESASWDLSPHSSVLTDSWLTPERGILGIWHACIPIPITSIPRPFRFQLSTTVQYHYITVCSLIRLSESFSCRSSQTLPSRSCGRCGFFNRRWWCTGMAPHVGTLTLLMGCHGWPSLLW